MLRSLQLHTKRQFFNSLTGDLREKHSAIVLNRSSMQYPHSPDIRIQKGLIYLSKPSVAMSDRQRENRTPLLVAFALALFLETPFAALLGFVFSTTRAMFSGVSGMGSGSSSGGDQRAASGVNPLAHSRRHLEPAALVLKSFPHLSLPHFTLQDLPCKEKRPRFCQGLRRIIEGLRTVYSIFKAKIRQGLARRKRPSSHHSVRCVSFSGDVDGPDCKNTVMINRMITASLVISIKSYELT